MIRELIGRSPKSESKTSDALRLFDLSKTDLPNAQAVTSQILAARTSRTDVIVDVDGPLIGRNWKFLRFGYAVGALPDHSRRFLQDIIRSDHLRPIIFTARISEGKLAEIFNDDGPITTMIQHSTSGRTELLEELIRLGIPRTDILFPDKTRDLFTYKLSMLHDLTQDRDTKLEHLLHPDTPFVYLGDTRTDLAISHQLTKNERRSGVYIQFPRAYPSGIF